MCAGNGGIDLSGDCKRKLFRLLLWDLYPFRFVDAVFMTHSYSPQLTFVVGRMVIGVLGGVC